MMLARSSAVNAIKLLGVRIDDVTMGEAVAWADEAIGRGVPHQIATVNVEFVMAARGHPLFREALNRADLCVPDSVGIMLGARIMGRRLRDRVPGVDLVGKLCKLAARREHRLFLLGAAAGVAEKAADKLQVAYPGLQIVGTYAGSPAQAEEEEIARRVRETAADMLFVAYGAPKQDLWIARNIGRCGVSLAMGVGGSLDYMAGVVPLAPPRWRRWGLEWLYRLYRQPWRWRRMLALPRFLVLILWARLMQGRADALEQAQG